MELAVIIIFAAMLILCVVLDLSILYALTAGLILFLVYGRIKHFSWKALFKMCLDGIKTAKNVLLNFLLIGMLTALWRAAGVIPVIVCGTVHLITPSLFLLMTFLLNSLVSFLTGTSFGTSATMGVVCMTMANALNISPALAGGAIFSGAYFGDRCSPVSTSALLTAELTHTDIYGNIKAMLLSAFVPFAAACIIYTLAGLMPHSAGADANLQSVFSREFSLKWYALLPALAILIPALFRVNVKLAMLSSIIVSVPVCIFLQSTSITELPKIMIMGYTAADSEVAAMLNGGGIVSMLKVSAIVCLSSSFSGIFRQTGLLDGAVKIIDAISARTTPYVASLCASLISGAIACNQTLSIMLTYQLCRDAETDNNRLALDIEDSAVIVAPLFPWSIAAAVPLASVGAPTVSLLFAVYLYLIPLWRIIHTPHMKMRSKTA